IIAHIAADHCLTFAAYGSRNRRHDDLANTIAMTIKYLDTLASSRVEHRPLSHGVVIATVPKNLKTTPIGRYPQDFQSLKRTPLLANGDDAVIWLSPAGEAVRWVISGSLNDILARRADRLGEFGRLSFIRNISKSLRGIGIGLRSDGSIMMFAKGQPVFVRRSGRWRGMIWAIVREAVTKKFGRTGEVAFDAAILLATKGEGGVIAILNAIPDGILQKDRVDFAKQGIASFEPDTEHSVKTDNHILHAEWLFHILLPHTSVISLGPLALSTLAAIDGATIIRRDGDLLAYGAVIPSKPGGAEGARSAAARELSNHGFVLKVSADGPIALFDKGVQLFEV
ncbi:MAG TPA: hypothetical protein VIN67_10695, partial [Desulfobaccales bacterium]